MYLYFYITLLSLKNISVYYTFILGRSVYLIYFFNLFCHKTCDKLIISNCYNNFFFNKPIFFHLICPTFYLIIFFLLEQVEYNIRFCWVKNCFNICIQKINYICMYVFMFSFKCIFQSFYNLWVRFRQICFYHAYLGWYSRVALYQMC